MKKKIKIIVAEDHPLMRKAYRDLFADYDDLKLIGEAENGEVLLELLENQIPDIILLDLEMPVMKGNEVFAIIKARFPKLKIIIVSVCHVEEYILDFLKRGANSYVTKAGEIDFLVETIYKVHEQGVYLNKNCSDALLSEVNKKLLVPAKEKFELTDREIEIIELIALGKTNKEIAHSLNIVTKTVDFHKANIYRKTKTYNSGGLTSFAYKNNLIGYPINN